MASQQVDLILRLKSDLEASLAKVNGALMGVDANAQRAGATLGKSMKGALKPITDLMSAFHRIGFVVTATIGSIVYAIKSLGDDIDKVTENAQKLGISAEEMSKRMYGFNISTTEAKIGAGTLNTALRGLASAWEWVKLKMAEASGQMTINATAQDILLKKLKEAESQGLIKNKVVSQELLAKLQRESQEEAKAGLQKVVDQDKQIRQDVIDLTDQLLKETKKADLSGEAYKISEMNRVIESARSKGVPEDVIGNYRRSQYIEIEKSKTRELMKQEAIRLKADGDTWKAMIKEQEIAYDAYVDQWGDNGAVVDAFRKGQIAILNEAKKTAMGITEFWKGTETSLTSAFESMFSDSFRGELRSAKDYFKDFALSVADEFSKMLAKMATNMIIFGNLAGQAGGGGGWTGGLGGLISKGIMAFFGGGGSTGLADNSSGAFFDAGAYHKGGIVKAHRGYLATDEVPLIAQAGEGILSKRGVNALGRSRFDKLNQGDASSQGGGVSITIAPVIQAWDASDVYRNRKQLSDVIAQDILTNGNIRKVIQQTGR